MSKASQEIKMQMELLSKIKKNNWTTIRVWLPKDSKGNFCVAHEACNVGHTSLQTKDLYASFWPNWTHTKPKMSGPVGALLGKADGVLFPDLKTDIRNEDKRQPDLTIILYSLSITKIKQAFDQFKISNKATKWSLMGANYFNCFNSGAGQSCAGLVRDLLNAGGAQNLATWDSISTTFTISPDAVAQFSVCAAKNEIELAISRALNCKSITEANFDLNPHKNKLGYLLGKASTKSIPSKATISFTPLQNMVVQSLNNKTNNNAAEKPKPPIKSKL